MNDLQRAARTRKLVYLGLIVGLFTLSMFWRGGLSLPFGDPNAPDPVEEVARRLGLNSRAPDFQAEAAKKLGLDADAADFTRQACEKLNLPYRGRFDRTLDGLARLPISQQATNLELSELDMGDPEIAGSAARVSLVGFRGVVITTLWSSAIEKQKRNEWHDFELYARLVTRLQPNFITPWLYQGWNISYNVSVENEKLGDMFFFIARGIELLSEGDKLNTKTVRRRGQTFQVGSPDLRREVAFFYQNKFTVSDKVTTLRCLMALTVMKPEDRSPARILKQNSSEVNDAAFRQFCEENPQLVRRLMTPRPNPTLGEKVTDTIAGSPQEIADFLAANTDLPTRWEKSGARPKPEESQFPTLPPAFDPLNEYYPSHPDLADRYDRFDALLAARAWFQYAQTVVPPPPRDANGVAYAAAAPRRPRDYDRNDPDAEYKYRMPQYPSLIIFRYYPARAQSYLAERLQKEGWYDAETEWSPDRTLTPASTVAELIQQTAAVADRVRAETRPEERAKLLRDLASRQGSWPDLAAVRPDPWFPENLATLEQLRKDMARIAGEKLPVETMPTEQEKLLRELADKQRQWVSEDQKSRFRGRRNSLAEWEEASRRWTAYGRDNGLDPSETMQAATTAAYRKTVSLFPPSSQLPDDLPPELADRFTADDLRLRKAFDCLPQNLQVTNYRRFRDESQAEATREMVNARKRLLAAEASRTGGALAAADEYATAIAEWRRALAKQEKYHQGERSDSVHEFSFDLEQKLTNLLKEDPAVVQQVNVAMAGLQAAVPAVAPLPVDATLPPDPLGTAALPRKDYLQLVAEEKAVTEIAVRMRVQALDPEGKDKTKAIEAEARKQVADPKQAAYLKRFTDREERFSWVRRDIRETKLQALGLIRKPVEEAPASGIPDRPVPQQMPGNQ